MMVVLVIVTTTAYSRLHFVRPVSGIIKYTQGVVAAAAMVTRKKMTWQHSKHPPPKHWSTFLTRRRRRRTLKMSCLRMHVLTPCNPSHGTCTESVSIIARGRFITRRHSFFTTTRIGCIMYIPSCPIRTPATMTTHHRPRHRHRHRTRPRHRDFPNLSTRLT